MSRQYSRPPREIAENITSWYAKYASGALQYLGWICQSIATHFCALSAKESRYEPFHLHSMKYTGPKYSETSRRRWEFFFSCMGRHVKSSYDQIMTITAWWFRCGGIIARNPANHCANAQAKCRRKLMAFVSDLWRWSCFPLVFADIKELLSQLLNTEKQFNDKQKAL